MQLICVSSHLAYALHFSPCRASGRLRWTVSRAVRQAAGRWRLSHPAADARVHEGRIAV